MRSVQGPNLDCQLLNAGTRFLNSRSSPLRPVAAQGTEFVIQLSALHEKNINSKEN